MKKLSNKSKGFTLIEVVLVLAIGALIILMAVLAFQGAQRSRRNTARINLVNQMKASVEAYAADNNGSYPTNGPTGVFIANLVANNGWKDPNSSATIDSPTTVADLTGTIGGIRYETGRTCSATNTFTGTTGYAIQYIQEGSSTLGCTDSTK